MKWCQIKFGAREGHRTSMDLPTIQDNIANLSIQEPFQYVERNTDNEAQVTDNSCRLNASIDTCHIEEGDPFVEALVA